MLGWPLRLPTLPAVLLTGMALSAASAPAGPVAVSPHEDAGQARARFVRNTLNGCQRPENSAGMHGFTVLQ